MPIFKPIEEKDASGKVKEIYEDIKKKKTNYRDTKFLENHG